MKIAVEHRRGRGAGGSSGAPRGLWFASALVLVALGCAAAPLGSEVPVEDIPLRSVDVDGALARRFDGFLDCERSDRLETLAACEARLASEPPSPEREYARARLHLAQAVVRRFEIDHGIDAEDPSADRRQVDDSIAAGLTHIDAALRADPQVADYHRVRGELLAMRVRGVLDGARFGLGAAAELERSREIDPANPHVWIAWGKRYLFAPPLLGRDLDRARACLEHARDLDPGLGESWFYLGSLEVIADRPAAARSALEECLRRTPGRRMAQILLDGLPRR